MDRARHVDTGPRLVGRVPRTRAGGEWTEAAFWGFLRSHLRLLSRSWPPRAQAMRAARRPYRGPDKRRKWEYLCAACGEWQHGKDVQVDHVEPCGELRDWSHVEPFVRRLLCEADGLRVLCKKCHRERK